MLRFMCRNFDIRATVYYDGDIQNDLDAEELSLILCEMIENLPNRIIFPIKEITTL